MRETPQAKLHEKLTAVKERLFEPTIIGPKINYIGLLAAAAGIDFGALSSTIINKFGSALELQRLLPLSELTFWVPAKIGLITAVTTFAGKALAVALTEPKKEYQPSRLVRLAWEIPAALIAAKLLGTRELMMLPKNLFGRPNEASSDNLYKEEMFAARDALIDKLTSHPRLDQTMVERLTNQASNVEGFQSFIRFALGSVSSAKKPEQSFSDYFKDTFLPTVVDAATAAGIHPYTLAAMVHYAFLVNQNKSHHADDILHEQLRLTFGSLNSATKRKLPNEAADFFSLAQFLAFPIKGVYGDDRTGAMNLIRENNEPTIGWQDMKITEIARGILNLMQIKSVDPNLSRLQARIAKDFPESINAAKKLEKAWQHFESQRTVTAGAIDALTETTQDKPLFKKLLAEEPDWEAWENLGFVKELSPWHSTHLTQTWKYYVELELAGQETPEDIGLTAMYLAITYYCDTAKQSGQKEAIRQLLVSQFEDEKFWPALAEKLPEHQKQIKQIVREAKKLQKLGQDKRNAVAEAFGIFSKQENNLDWQAAALVGIGSYFIKIINKFPHLKKLAVEEPLWQLYGIMAARELSPANLYVKRDKYPLVTDIDLSTDAENVIRRLDLLAGKCQKYLNKPTAAMLLPYMIYYDLAADPAEVKLLYEDLYWGRAWSGIKVANNEYAQMTAGDY